jgi:hypothetical protein
VKPNQLTQVTLKPKADQINDYSDSVLIVKLYRKFTSHNICGPAMTMAEAAGVG